MICGPGSRSAGPAVLDLRHHRLAKAFLLTHRNIATNVGALRNWL